MLRSTDINTLTPIEAMNVLVKLIALAENKSDFIDENIMDWK